jgi:hypothetical protein
VKLVRFVAALALAGAAAPAFAGPPYQTDDPEPTELGHWEIYIFNNADGHRSDVDAEAGLDLNYGAVKDVQLTATVPVAYSHSSGPSDWRFGRGDLELGVKYRFVNDEKKAFQAAIFPRVILPTSSNNLGGDRARLLLPLWLQKDWGKTSLFGGGGYEFNPGAGNRNFFVGGVTLTHAFTDSTSVGAELSYQARDIVAGSPTKGMNLGVIQKLGGPFSLLAAGGPTFSGGQTGYHSYLALALNY